LPATAGGAGELSFSFSLLLLRFGAGNLTWRSR